jgi:hypothetical protein
MQEVCIMASNKVHEEILCEPTPPPPPSPDVPSCGYRKCCPTVKLFDDGSVELDDDDTESGSVGTIKLRPEAAERLVRLLTTQRR